jgi:hypothetical protein
MWKLRAVIKRFWVLTEKEALNVHTQFFIMKKLQSIVMFLGRILMLMRMGKGVSQGFLELSPSTHL